MIKFFRQIRLGLMGKNKTSQYLKYAIGEIVLVVIGILIALQINNANELQKLEKTKQAYYKQLLIDLDKDSTNISGYIERTQHSIDTYNDYLNKFNQPNLKPKDVLDQLDRVDFTFPIIRFNTNTIETLKSTGDIKLIPTEIRNNLIEIKRTQETIKDAQFLNDSEYIKVLTLARQLGFSTINTRLGNQRELAEVLKIDKNTPEIILILDSAFRLKNFTENNRILFFEEILAAIEDSKRNIIRDMK